MNDKDRIVELLPLVPKAPSDTLPAGATPEQLNAFEQRTGIQIPPELSSWLSISNGPGVGPGGFLGLETSRRGFDIDQYLALCPIWKEKKWIPVASDGCGNFYVVPTNGEFGAGFPVVFVDLGESYDSPAYIVASGVFKFIRFLLERELGATQWPFDSEQVVRCDPDILKFRGVALPWE
ncbi:MAG TPA: SMI1/KNR4 family protein [Pirellulales bacterium]|nr:SMI1/KNR4 family protein [Pirellulales bacterium]